MWRNLRNHSFERRKLKFIFLHSFLFSILWRIQWSKKYFFLSKIECSIFWSWKRRKLDWQKIIFLNVWELIPDQQGDVSVPHSPRGATGGWALLLTLLSLLFQKSSAPKVASLCSVIYTRCKISLPMTNLKKVLH